VIAVGFTVMGPDMRNEAARFVTLIDALYEHKVKLLAAADAEPAGLYPSGDGSFEFERTVSRLEEMRSAVTMARARERRSDALSAESALALATIDAARALRLDAEVGTLTPGKRADLAVVSLAGSPYHPVEDPAAAVVFGGSPDRVLETIVDGQTRYRKTKEEQWREVRSIASAARARMLGSPQPRPR